MWCIADGIDGWSMARELHKFVFVNESRQCMTSRNVFELHCPQAYPGVLIAPSNSALPPDLCLAEVNAEEFSPWFVLGRGRSVATTARRRCRLVRPRM